MILLYLVGICLAAEPAALPPSKEGPVIAVDEWKKEIAGLYPELKELYEHLHSHPELSLAEEQTAARLAKELRAAGLEVTERVGGWGVVAVLKNAAGPTVLVRADMDALPITEKTGVPYASQAKVRRADGQEVGVMHACGHDVNMTCLVGTARMLAKHKDRWSGTLVFIGQPAEEIGAGARRMLADGLFIRFPKPDLALALHCDSRLPHGQVNYRAGQMQANVDSVDVTVRGRGGHGAAPQAAIDPVVIAAKLILDLQTIASREIDPLEAAVVTVGSIHGGAKHNIIPGEVKLQLTVRTTNDKMRDEVLASIERKAKAAALSAAAPDPTIKIDRESYTPALYNDATLAARFSSLFRRTLGKEQVQERPMSLGGEDFSQFVRAGVPGFYFFLGTVSPERWAEAKAGGRPLPATHSDAYAPVPQPTIQTGVLAMTLAVLDVVGK